MKTNFFSSLIIFFIFYNSFSAFSYDHRPKDILITYPVPVGAKKANDVVLSANGKDVGIYDLLVSRVYNWGNTMPSVFGSFDFSGGDVVISITFKSPLKSVIVRPLNQNVIAKIDNQTVSFKVSKAGQYVVEINDNPRVFRPVIVFANEIEQTKPSKKDTAVKYFEAGKVYDVGLINLTSNQTLYIEGGAVVKGYINAVNASSINIKGRGILYSTDPATGGTIAPVWIKDCHDVKAEGVIFVNSEDEWTFHVMTSYNINVQNVKILSEVRDGFDIDGSNRVIVNGCYVQAHDDALCIKSTNISDPFQYGGNQSVFDVDFTNCVLFNAAGGNAIEIGHEVWCPSIYNITFSNIDVIHSWDGGERAQAIWPEAAIGIHVTDHAVVKDILFENIRVEDVTEDYVMDVYIFRNPQLPRDSPNRGHIKNITLRNISVLYTETRASRFQGFDDNHMVEGIVIENFVQEGKKITTPREGNFQLGYQKDIKIL